MEYAAREIVLRDAPVGVKEAPGFSSDKKRPSTCILMEAGDEGRLKEPACVTIKPPCPASLRADDMLRPTDEHPPTRPDRYLRSETVEPAYAERRSASALDVYTFKLSAWLKTESTKSRKQKRSLKQMHADLCVLGFEGSYDRVAAFARQWKVDQLDRVNAASKGTANQHSVFPATLEDPLAHLNNLLDNCERNIFAMRPISLEFLAGSVASVERAGTLKCDQAPSATPTGAKEGTSCICINILKYIFKMTPNAVVPETERCRPPSTTAPRYPHVHNSLVFVEV
jgi:hypothetical protein